MGSLVLVSIANELANGNFNDLATCAATLGVYQKVTITLPYGFTLSVEHPSKARGLATNEYELGAITSMVENCGSLLITLGRVDINIDLLNLVLVFNGEIGLKGFLRICPELSMDRDMLNRALSFLRCNNEGDLLNLANEAIISAFGGVMPVDICLWEELVPFYQRMVQCGAVEQMRRNRAMNGYGYPSVV